ncbi:MAG TPA: hypothetical protein VFA50_00440 [Stellaceae bacterium]|nr:hypothetical protein [Stellaceae bacterium]
MLDEGTQFRQGLAPARIIEEDPGRRDGKGREQRVQSALFDRRLGERAGQLSKAQPLERRSEERRVVMRDERPGDDHFDGLVAFDKWPGRD